MVSFISSPDFENPTDAGSDNGYDIVIQATESGNTFVTTRSVTVTVSNVVETAPSITSGGSASFAENGTGAVYTVRASASDGDGSISYSISGGADSAQFSINSSSGVVSFKNSPDFETPTDAGSDNIYNLEVKATEAGNAVTATRSVAVTVSNVVETAPSIISGSSVSFAENATGAVYTARASASDGDGSISYSISGGADSAKFSINGSGVVSFISSPDFEAPTDAGSNNVYDLVITATEAGNAVTASRSVAVTVTNISEGQAPGFTSGSSASFAENGTGAVYTAVATPDVTGASVGYSISGGADSAKFSINGSGVVSFISSPDFEAPTDAGSNKCLRPGHNSHRGGQRRHRHPQRGSHSDEHQRGAGSRVHQRQQCQLCRERYGCGLYRSGDTRCDRGQHRLQHQRWCRLGQVQHRQQQRGGQLYQQSEP